MGDERLFSEAAASAIAGFTLAQFSFYGAIKSGLLPKAEAEQLLKGAIEACKKGGPVQQMAGAKLQVVLNEVIYQRGGPPQRN